MKNLIIVVLVLVLLAFGWSLMQKGDADIENKEDTVPVTIGEATLPNGTFTADADKSTLKWEGSKTLILNYKDSGSIKLASGVVMSENGMLKSGEIVIDMTSIAGEATSNTKVPVTALTTHLKSTDFFDVEKYPTATLMLKSLKKTEVEGTFLAEGDMTIKGITQPVSFPVTWSEEADGAHVRGKATLDRTLWDVRYGSGKFFDNLGDGVVDDMFTVEFDVVGTVALTPAASAN